MNLPVVGVSAIADALIECQTELSLWQQRREALLKQLSAAHDAGVVPTSWQHSGYSFVRSDGRRTLQLSDDAKAAIERFKEKAIERGDATWKQGDPFWTVKVVR